MPWAVVRHAVVTVYPTRESAEHDMARMVEAKAPTDLSTHYTVESTDRSCKTCGNVMIRPMYVDFEGHGPADDDVGCMAEDRMEDADWDLAIVGMCPRWVPAEDEEPDEQTIKEMTE